MSEADRVFPRHSFAESHPTPEDKQLLHIAPRRRGSGPTRVVEVVHLPAGRTKSPAEPAAPPRSAHAETWPEGFRAKPALAMPTLDQPAAAPEAAPQVGHVMPGWEPLLPPAEAEAPQPRQPRAAARAASAKAPPVAAASAPDKQDPDKQDPEKPAPSRRAFADPFAAEDTGTNCLRCGYLVQPGREKRGLLTCAQCG
ncbi:hypothetical protein QWZ14_23935 [Paeniroseomonas aquatica]|uniref:Uncharacterized protein n=2 Tax=Paeniroseomonas aquatica TaxID=373043 RepID=A0ABT8AC88_9PROT|nr:hypothetical protein [Paeniroseomonas aquatica]MDN3567442.1 hypothetical protein [Paeniroseomonas aquatica]